MACFGTYANMPKTGLFRLEPRPWCKCRIISLLHPITGFSNLVGLSSGRDLAAIPTPQLQTMAEQLRRRIERECGSLQFSAGVQLCRDDDTREATQVWNA